MDALKRLVAIEEIKVLKARYFRCMDTKDWDGLATVFTPDAVFDLSQVNSVRHLITGEWQPPFDPSAVHTGKADVLNMIRTAVQSLLTVHHGHMSEIEIESDTRACGVWAMEDVIRNAPGQPEFRMQGYGHYHEVYERLATSWAIKRTKITRLYFSFA
jgi:SnoaL-like domain